MAKYSDQRLTKAQQKKAKPANQGGGPNYLGKQETVTVPKKWLSSPDHVVAELAYITPREQKILLDADLYGSLKGKPNKGPGGIMSLQGDLGGYDASPGGPNSGGAGGNRVGQGDKNKQRVQDILRGNVTTGQTVAVSDRTRRNAMPEYVNTPGGMKYVGSSKKFVGKSLFNPSGYRNVVGTQGILDRLMGKKDIKTRGTPGTPGFEYYSEDENVGDAKPGIGGRALGGLLSLLTGIPVIGSAIGSAIDKYKPKPKDMSEFNKLGLFGINPSYLDFDPNAKIQDTSFITGDIKAPPSKVNTLGIDVGYDDPAFTNDLMAEITQQDINKSKMRGFNSMDYNTAIDLGIISPNVTGYEFDQLQKGNITEPGTYTA
jgi:hypothetical protein